MKTVTGQLRIWVCSGVITQQAEMTTHINPRLLTTLAHSEDQALGEFVRWLGASWPNQAIQRVAAWPVPDDFVKAAWNDIQV